jgi:hypothetical protein
MSTLGTTHKQKVKCLAESGASAVLVSEGCVRRAGLRLHPCFEEMTLADGQSLLVLGKCSFPLSIQGYVGQVDAYAAQLAPACDIFLGESWMMKHATVEDYSALYCSVLVVERRVVLRCEPRGPPKALVVSALQMKRLILKGNPVQLLIVRVSQNPFCHVRIRGLKPRWFHPPHGPNSHPGRSHNWSGSTSASLLLRPG